MNSTPKRILHITEMLSAAGIESFIMNVYRNIDRSKIQFDFLVLRDQKEFYDDEIASLGGKKYCIHSDIIHVIVPVFRVIATRIEACRRSLNSSSKCNSYIST